MFGSIITALWAIFGKLLVDIAITIGLPKAMEVLLQQGLPKWIADGLILAVKKALEDITKAKTAPEMDKAAKRAEKKRARREAKECIGALCETRIQRI